MKIEINRAILTPCPAHWVLQKLPLGSSKVEHFLALWSHARQGKGINHAHLWPIWYHSEPSNVPNPRNQFLDLDFFAVSYCKTALVKWEHTNKQSHLWFVRHLLKVICQFTWQPFWICNVNDLLIVIYQMSPEHLRIGLNRDNRTGHPNLPDRSCQTGLNPDLYFQTFYVQSTGIFGIIINLLLHW